MRKTLLTSAAFALLLAAPAFAQTTTGTANASAPAKTWTALDNVDTQFLKHSAEGADYELSISKLALQKSNQQDIKTYAQQVVNDHEKTNAQLQRVAAEHGVQLPTGMIPERRSEYEKLKGLSGHQFDQAYVSEMNSVNKKDADQERTEASEIKSPQVKSLALEMQKTDQRHAQEASKLKA